MDKSDWDKPKMDGKSPIRAKLCTDVDRPELLKSEAGGSNPKQARPYTDALEPGWMNV